MRHQSKKGFCGIFVKITQHQKGYSLYVPVTRKIISSYDAVFYESFSITLSYKSQPYEEAMAVSPAVSYTPYTTSSMERTGNIITFTQFEEGGLLSETQNLLSETCDDTESSNGSDDNSTMPPLISEEEIYAIYSGDESDSEPISIEMLEYIRDGIQSYPGVNGREACYKVCDCIKQRQTEWKGALLYMRNMSKYLQKSLRLSLMIFCKFYQSWVNLDQRFLILFQNLEFLQK